MLRAKQTGELFPINVAGFCIAYDEFKRQALTRLQECPDAAIQPICANQESGLKLI